VQSGLCIENELIAKTFAFQTKEAGAITVAYELKDGQSKMALTVPQGVPYFEFAINGQIVSALDKSWMFKKTSKRDMQNGGVEHLLVFEGVQGAVDGLEVHLYQQVFPNATMIREKMELWSPHGHFALSKVNGELHFKFPSYALLKPAQAPAEVTEIKIASWERSPITFGDQTKGNHMFYPKVSKRRIQPEKSHLKGPISIVQNGEFSWLSLYEHASQDDLNGMFDTQKLGTGNQINDAMQGTKGIFDFSLQEKDLTFLGMANQEVENTVHTSLEMLRGGYLEGEIINKVRPFASVWSATGIYRENGLEAGKKMLHQYLLHQICEKPASRKPQFYYNTWGLQREDKHKPLREILTYDRIYEEIERAAQLGVDVFVLDDGWENKQGEWFPNQERFPNGLQPIKDRLDAHGIKMGLWFSPMGIDASAKRYKDHFNWVIKDSENNPITAQWDHPAFDFVSDFFDLFVSDCKKLIDQGCKFMKWDAINTFYSSLPNLHHGDERYAEEELRARYDYLLPIYVVKAMEMLTEYEPELVIELDITEARRVMVGLAPFSQGKLFWMNNGASTYNDYSTFRTKATRTIANEYAGIIPLQLITYANYPHNTNNNMVYNVYNSLLAGHGFWGNLEALQASERTWIGQQVAISKKLLPYQTDVLPEIQGKVGDSPEVYKFVNQEAGAGHVFAFSEEGMAIDVDCQLNPDKLLAVLNQPYTGTANGVELHFDLRGPDAAEVAFILPNEDQGVSIRNSSNKIAAADFGNGVLAYTVADAGEQEIHWDKKNGAPHILENPDLTWSQQTQEDHYVLTVSAHKATNVQIAPVKTKIP
jgi:hypothetical protein